MIAKNLFPCLLACLLSTFGIAKDTPSAFLGLWYEQPAAVWTEALPVGNGRLGAMVHGRTDLEEIQFNEDTLWSGAPLSYDRDGAVDVLDDLRQILAEGRRKDAEALAMETFMGVPLRQSFYQSFASLMLDFGSEGEVTDYRRELDLRTAIASVAYSRDGVRYTRETFSSFPDQVIVQHLTASKKRALNLSICYTSLHTAIQVTPVGQNELLLTGQVAPEKQMLAAGKDHEGMRFAARVKVITKGGNVTAEGDRLVVRDAQEVTLLLAADTNFVSFQDLSADPVAATAATLQAVGKKKYADLRRRHLADYQPLFARMEIDLGHSAYDAWPTDKRLERADKSDDPSLAALFFQYGRFMLIGSSRPGSQPANLQGIWNHRNDPPWGSKYTLNINAEMNYWPAEVANLSELHAPFFGLIDDLTISGAEVAQKHYGAPGWVVHHNTDLWRGAAPINHANHGIWPTGGAWLCQHLWEHFRYTQDQDFLRTRAYPVMKGAAEFFMATLVEDPQTGWLISGPSNSPEHGGLVMGPTMDHQLIRSLFGWVIETETILGITDGLSAQLEPMRAKIAPNQIGQHGQLQEWLTDVDDPKDDHRHVSHLWAVFPGEEITPATPELMKAARTSLTQRGDGGTGWSLGWKISLWARFLDGDHAHRILMNQFKLIRDMPDGSRQGDGGGVYPNLFDAHPPFQIDGNFAATAGICEMLVQSHHEITPPAGQTQAFALDLLPALPTAFGTGSITGLRTRGGFELDLQWRDQQLTSVTIRAIHGGMTRLRYRNQSLDLTLKAGESRTFGPDLTPLR